MIVCFLREKEKKKKKKICHICNIYSVIFWDLRLGNLEKGYSRLKPQTLTLVIALELMLEYKFKGTAYML